MPRPLHEPNNRNFTKIQNNLATPVGADRCVGPLHTCRFRARAHTQVRPYKATQQYEDIKHVCWLCRVEACLDRCAQPPRATPPKHQITLLPCRGGAYPPCAAPPPAARAKYAQPHQNTQHCFPLGGEAYTRPSRSLTEKPAQAAHSGDNSGRGQIPRPFSGRIRPRTR